MELKDIEDENQRGDRGKTPDRLDAGQQQRRGSHLLAAAGIGYENRRRLSQQNAEAQGRVFQRGNEVTKSFLLLPLTFQKEIHYFLTQTKRSRERLKKSQFPNEITNG